MKNLLYEPVEIQYVGQFLERTTFEKKRFKFRPWKEISLCFVTAHLTKLLVDTFLDASTTTAVVPVVVPVETERPPLTDAEIAGIVCACLIFVAGIVIAVIYYWFCRIGPVAAKVCAIGL